MLVILASGFTWGMTILGSLVVFAIKEVNRRLLDGMLGFAAGVMMAASYWSLLAPAIEMAHNRGNYPWLPAVSGFLMGGVFLYVIDKLIPHLHIGFDKKSAEGLKTNWKASTLLILAITLHNIPEGLAVGFAFGALSLHTSNITLSSAIALASGIGIQNVPEGAAVSVPLKREGFSSLKSFFYGALSGAVEPISAIIAFEFVIYTETILPYALSFAAGAMIYVVIEEVIPESQLSKDTDIATIAAMLGFTLMMFLDVAFK